jgi:hypothetical protein
MHPAVFSHIKMLLFANTVILDHDNCWVDLDSMGLYTYFFQPLKWTQQYNCTFYSVEDVPLDKRRHVIYAIIVLTLFVIYEVGFFTLNHSFLRFFISRACTQCFKSQFDRLFVTNWCCKWQFTTSLRCPSPRYCRASTLSMDTCSVACLFSRIWPAELFSVSIFLLSKFSKLFQHFG